MTIRAAYPIIYEINTWVWLGELSVNNGRRIHLGDVPAEAWDALADLGIDALWLMGVWERSPAGADIAARNQGLMADFKGALSDFTPQDNVGSPYCIRDYVVDARLGGPDGLAEARRRLAERNIALILDFVPNHVAPDHAWTAEHPDYFIRGDRQDAGRDPGAFMWIGDRVFACGRDPHYPAWPDVVQLNIFHPDTRRAVIEVILNIAGQCDGVRCDVAMLLMNAIFAKTWGPRAGPEPGQEFWPEIIGAVRKDHPSFLFLAEVYWDLEWQLQQQGFDFCYDKRLYDRLEQGNAESVRQHLHAGKEYQDRLIRFIENHDERRAAAAFPPKKLQAAAVAAATLPGARLFHEGQFEGRRIRLPVFLGRRPAETVDADLRTFYRTLLNILKSECLRNGRWRLCERIDGPDAAGAETLVAWSWRDDTENYLVVVNLSDAPARGKVQLPRRAAAGGSWTDLFVGNRHEVKGDGLSVDLPSWGFHVLKCK
jgi:glycosidase